MSSKIYWNPNDKKKYIEQLKLLNDISFKTQNDIAKFNNENHTVKIEFIKKLYKVHKIIYNILYFVPSVLTDIISEYNDISISVSSDVSNRYGKKHIGFKFDPDSILLSEYVLKIEDTKFCKDEELIMEFDNNVKVTYIYDYNHNQIDCFYGFHYHFMKKYYNKVLSVHKYINNDMYYLEINKNDVKNDVDNNVLKVHIPEKTYKSVCGYFNNNEYVWLSTERDKLDRLQWYIGNKLKINNYKHLKQTIIILNFLVMTAFKYLKVSLSPIFISTS